MLLFSHTVLIHTIIWTHTKLKTPNSAQIFTYYQISWCSKYIYNDEFNIDMPEAVCVKCLKNNYQTWHHNDFLQYFPSVNTVADFSFPVDLHFHLFIINDRWLLVEYYVWLAVWRSCSMVCHSVLLQMNIAMWQIWVFSLPLAYLCHRVSVVLFIPPTCIVFYYIIVLFSLDWLVLGRRPTDT